MMRRVPISKTFGIVSVEAKANHPSSSRPLAQREANVQENPTALDIVKEGKSF